MIISLNETLLKAGSLYDHLNDLLYYPLIVQKVGYSVLGHIGALFQPWPPEQSAIHLG